MGVVDNHLTDRCLQATNWVLNSGIQSKDGAFFGWYDSYQDNYPFIYGEMIGYGITTSLWLYDRTQLDIHLERAKQAANWLKEIMIYDGDNANAKGAVIWRYYPDSKRGPELCYSFDNGMCLSGIVELYRITGSNRYLELAENIAKWLIVRMQNPDGSFKPFYNYRDDVYRGNKWSQKSGTFHLKIVIGLLKLYEETNDNELLQSAVKLANWARGLQKPSGEFRINADSNETYLHPHCYTLEGWLYLHLFLHETEQLSLLDYDILEIVRKGFEWALSCQKQDYGFSRIAYYSEEKSLDETSETLAQMIRIDLLLSELGPSDSRLDLEKSVQRLFSFQDLDSSNKKVRGGFAYGILEGEKVDHYNCWATFFSLQALTMYKDHLSGKKEFNHYIRWLI